MLRAVLVLVLLLGAACVTSHHETWSFPGREHARGPRVLAVTAHPDDETAFAATLYAITRQLDGACDLAVITNGEGGFKYSTLAEPIYGVELTREPVGRRELPAIRRRELGDSAKLLHLRELHFFNQRDHRYTLDLDEVFGANARVWDLPFVRQRLRELLQRGAYDLVFVLMPTQDTHAHHQAATILALEAIATLPASEQPLVLAARTVEAGDASRPTTVDDYPITQLSAGDAPFVLDRTRKFGHENKLDLRILVNWVIAAHKSQGSMQLYVNQGALEQFWCFEFQRGLARERATELFDALSAAPAAVSRP